MRSGAAAIPAGSRSNENTNGLLRQYFRKGMSFAALSQDDLDTVATSLNDRPRKTPDFAAPGQQFHSLLATMAAAGSRSPGVRSQTRIRRRSLGLLVLQTTGEAPPSTLVAVPVM